MNKFMFAVLGVGFSFEYGADKQGRRTTTCLACNQRNGATLKETVTCSLEDRFSKKTGRKAALAKAIRHLDVASRTQIWAEYFKHVNK